MVKGYLLWPTWTYLPPYLPTERPMDLDISLRIFSTEGFRSNDGWPRQPGTAFRDLLAMLKRFLHFGPSFFVNMECPPGGLPAGWLPSEQLAYEDASADIKELIIEPARVPSPPTEDEQSDSLFKINKLSVNTTFDDEYTHDTWAYTMSNIFRMLKALATSGVAGDVIKTVQVRGQDTYKGRTKVFDASWPVAEEVNEEKVKQWVLMGFMEPGKLRLSE